MRRYYDPPGKRTAANLITRDEARRIAANITKLPKLRARYQRPSLGCVHSAMVQVANPVARGAIHHAPIASGRHRAPAPRQHGGRWPCDVDKLVSDLQAFVEIDRRLNELERRAGAAPSGK